MTGQKKEAIEGYFLTTKDNLIFDVKGIAHPSDRIIAFVRYVPIEFGLEDKPKRKVGAKILGLLESPNQMTLTKKALSLNRNERTIMPGAF